jgi:hypothetical protein
VAQTKRKRKRKHRGTPAGTIERAGRTGRPRTREDAKQISRQRRAERMDRPPTWRGAINRAAIAAVLAFGREPAQGAALAAFMFVVYIPLSYGTDLAMHRFRRRRKAAGKS